MPSTSDFEDAVNRLETAVENIGDEVLDGVDNDEGKQVGHTCHHGDYKYLLHGSPDDQYFTIGFPFSIVNNVGEILDESSAKEILPDGKEVDEDESITTLAAYDILEGMSSENRQKFQYHLTQELSTTDTSFRIRHTDSGAITGFDVYREIFPYEEEFSLAEFNHSVQTVVNTGHKGVLFVSTSFDIESYVANQTGSGKKENLRYIQ